MKIHSFGCSFVAGNGVNTKVENTLNGTPGLRQYRERHSFTGQLSKLLDCEYNNHGKSGSNPNYLIDKIAVEIEANTIKQGDLVIACFTSPLRNTPDFIPTFFEPRGKTGIEGITFGQQELEFHKTQYFNNPAQGVKPIKQILQYYKKDFITKYFDYSHHFDYYSQNTVFFLQYLFDFYKINHIFIDAFDIFVSNEIYDKTEFIDKSKYWRFKEDSIWSYLNKYKDKSLFEQEDLHETLYNGKLHPSADGHKLIAEELYKTYKKTYE